MSRRSEKRLYEINRERVRDALIRAGTDPITAKWWCDRWEAEAARQGIDRYGDYFWDAGKGWIDAQREVTRPLR